MRRTPIGKLATFINGRAFKPSEWETSGLPIIRIQNLTGSSDVVNYYSGQFDPKHLVIRGDILISWSASLGVYKWQDEDAILNQHIFKAVPKEGMVDKDYFYYAISSVLDDMLAQVHGTTMRHITKGPFEATQIPLPPLPDQKRIAGILDKADRLRRLRRYALTHSDTYLQSVFLEMFHTKASPEWPRVTVASLAKQGRNSIRTGPFGSQLLHTEFVDEGIAVLGIDNAVQNRFVWAKPRFITEEKYQRLGRYRVFPGDVIITIMGTLGRCAIVPDDIPLAINTKHLCCITLDGSRCLPNYLRAAFLNHPAVLQQLGVSERGAVMPGLNMQLIKELVMPLPPIRLQRRFAQIVHKFERFRAQQREAQRQAEHLFQTLLHQAFQGEL